VLVPLITSLRIESMENEAVLRPGGPEKMILRIERDLAAV
jgi:hypothetical protein